ncbi:anti-sigma factor [Aquimarina agarivorans]|uniref:anti-sigma factor n=1 Tax=Aquimarina agarivorans TaxID=980584 RepID=UPI000248E9DE|nr:anti-sigma factor [Aquimarina agarivorans]
MKLSKLIFGAAALSFLAVACDSDDGNEEEKKPSGVNLAIEGLEALGSDFVYEGWLIVGEAPVSTGRFTDPTLKFQEVEASVLETATAFVLSIEPADETGEALAAPAATKLFRADFAEGVDTATISYKTINEKFADLSTAKDEISGKFFLRTPTDEALGAGDNSNDEAGVWFGTPGTMPPAASLELPVLAADSGWKYEGWAVVNGVPYSTGTFSDPKAADDNAMASLDSRPIETFRGAENFGPPIPGEDFINNLEGTGFEGGADLKGATIVISLEPVPDNDPKPFTLKPLDGMAGQETAPTAYDFEENLESFPTGTITR